MVLVFLALAAVSWVVVSSIRVGQGNTASSPDAGLGTPFRLGGGDRADALAPSPKQFLRSAQRVVGSWAVGLGPALARDWRVAKAVALDGLRGAARLASRRRRSVLAGPATWYEVQERPWRT